MNIIINGVNINPGQHVLLTTPDGWELQDVLDLQAQLENRLPGVKFTFIDGVDIIGVYNEEPAILELDR